MSSPARLVFAALLALATLACGPTGSAGRSAPAVATAQPAPAAVPTQPQAAAQPTAAPQPQTASTQPGQRAKVRGGGLGGVTDRPYFVGEGKGFYSEQGIELEV